MSGLHSGTVTLRQGILNNNHNTNKPEDNNTLSKPIRKRQNQNAR